MSIPRPQLGAPSAQSTPWFVHRSGVMAETAPGVLSDVLRLLQGDADPWAASCPIGLWRVPKGVALYRESSRCDAIHVIRSGTFKCLKTLEDGYEQVLAFSRLGDVLGFEAAASNRHPYGVVALEDSSVYALPLRELDAWRRQCAALDRALMRSLGHQLERVGETAELMAAVAAEVRLARFLVALSGQMAARGQSPTRLLLRMTRRDIASLLGVAHETISRGFALLAEWGLLRVDSREVEIINLDGLKACARSTRRDMDDLSHRHAHTPAAPASLTGPRAAPVARPRTIQRDLAVAA